MAQIKTIRGKGILTKKDISYEEVSKKVETIQKPVGNLEKTKHDHENNVVVKKKAEDIEILDDDVDHDLEVMNALEEDVIVNSILDHVIDKATRKDNVASQNKSEEE